MEADPQQILAERDKEIAAINGRVEWSEEHKAGRIRAVEEWAREEYQKAKEAKALRLQENLGKAKNSLYRVPTEGSYNEAESAQVHTAFMTAWDHVLLSTADPSAAEEELEALLEQAERTGNPLLSRAVFHRALDLHGSVKGSGPLAINLQPILDRYLADNPREAKALEKYNAAKEEVNRESSLEGMLSNVMTSRLFAG